MIRKKLEYLKVCGEKVKKPVEKMKEEEIKRFETILSRELNSEKDAYDNILEMEEFLSKPHDYIPDARNKANEKLYAIQNIMGKDILEKGIEIHELDKTFKEIYSVMSLEERLKKEQEIIKSPKLAEQLNYLRYNPRLSKKLEGEIIEYQAVYSKMMEEARIKEYEEQNKDSGTSELDER